MRCTLAGAFLVFLIGSAIADSFEEGMDAYERYDYSTALQHWQPLAEQGDAKAQYQIGRLYRMGLDIETDYTKAAKWLRLAADQGNAEAQFELSLLYHRGQGVQQNSTEGVMWLRNAAKNGHAQAQYNLCVVLANGQLLPQDMTAAIEWCRLSAEQGYAHAQFKMGVWYAKGTAITQDRAKAKEWFKLAAAQGNPGAQLWMGRFAYYQKDYVQAYKWLSLSYSRYHAADREKEGLFARKLFDQIISNMTEEQIAEGHRQAGAFRPIGPNPHY